MMRIPRGKCASLAFYSLQKLPDKDKETYPSKCLFIFKIWMEDSTYLVLIDPPQEAENNKSNEVILRYRYDHNYRLR